MSGDVEIGVTHGIGRIVLNRPRALNALTHDMEVAIDEALTRWERDAAVGLVLIEGRGERGLCAGGDIRALYDAAREGRAGLAYLFFGDEYRMNAHIANYPKPYVALMDGIVMGGGVGLSAHGSHRIVTEKTMLAMPEVAIGFVPDIGGSYLYGQMPGETGVHASMTGARLSGADAIFAGLADHFVKSERLHELAEALAGAEGHDEVTARIGRFAEAPPESALEAAQGWIDRCYAKPTAEAILAALDAEAGEGPRAAAATLRKASPTSVKLTLRLLREAKRDRRVEAAIDREYRVAVRCVAGHDFVEGVRAQLVEKDRNPRWQPATLEAVPDSDLEPYFASLGEKELGLAKAGNQQKLFGSFF